MSQLALLDSSFVYSLYDPHEIHHAQTLEAIALHSELRFVLADVVLVEAGFLMRRTGGVPLSLTLLDRVNEAGFALEPLDYPLLVAARRIMAGYAQAKFDLVDCILMAMGEKLNIRHICTYDRRDFSIFRPAHCPYLTLIP